MATSYLKAFSLFSRDVRLYLITVALFGFTFGIYAVLLNLYLLRLSYGPEFVGLINAASGLPVVLFGLPAGALGGRLGIRRVMIAGMSTSVVGLGFLPLSEFIPKAYQAGWLVAAYALAWLGVAFYGVNGFPFLMGATGPEERNHAFSMWAALNPLAGFAGSLVGGLLPGLFAMTLGLSLDYPAPYRYPLLIAAGFLIPSVLMLIATREVSVGRKQATVAETGPFPFGLITIMALVLLLRGASEGAGRIFFNVYLDANLHVSTAQIGALSAVGQLLSVPVALVAPLLMARWGNGRILVWGLLGTALSLLPMAFIPHWIASGVSFMSLLVMVSITTPAYSLFCQEVVSSGWRAAMSGATFMAVGLSFAAMAFSGGYIITALGYRSLFLIGAGLTAVGALLFWAYFLRVPRGEFASLAAVDKAK
jgi:MFS family permease